MVSSSAWENTTYTLLAQIEQEIEAVRREYDERLSALERQREAVQGAIGVYRDRLGKAVARAVLAPLTQDEVKGKSQREVMELIAARNGGVFVAKDAFRLMVDLGMFGNPDNAYGIVYKVLSREGSRFEKVAPGVYRLKGLAGSSSAERPQIQASGSLREKVREYKVRQPEATRREVADWLVAAGWDFGASAPIRAVAGAWMAIANEGKGKTDTIQLSLT